MNEACKLPLYDETQSRELARNCPNRSTGMAEALTGASQPANQQGTATCLTQDDRYSSPALLPFACSW
jgi:hypothetical protein